MMTVPALPLSDASVWTRPSASGSEKSATTAPSATEALALVVSRAAGGVASEVRAGVSASSATTKRLFIICASTPVKGNGRGAQDSLANPGPKFKALTETGAAPLSLGGERGGERAEEAAAVGRAEQVFAGALG